MMRALILIALVATSCRPTLPEISLTNIDPAVAQVISNRVAAVRSNPNSSSAWGTFGMVLKAAGLESQAKECFVRAEKLDPTEPRWPYFQGSIESLKRAAALSGQPFIRSRLAQMLLEAGRFAEAEEQFAGARDALGMAQVACAQQKWENAVPHLDRARRSDASRKAATTLLANVSLRRGETEAARSLSIEAAAMPSDTPRPNLFETEIARYAIGKRAWIESAQELLGRKQVAEAAPIIERLVTLYPDSAEGWLYLGRACLLQSNLVAAEQALARHLRLDPPSVDGHMQMGLVYYHQNRLAEAAAEFQDVLKSKPDSENAHYFLGQLRRRQGDTQGAIKSFQEALRCDPAFEPARKVLEKMVGPAKP